MAGAGFRLLSELYSLLFSPFWPCVPFCPLRVSVSSRSYILSYLYKFLERPYIPLSLFPSPLGVIFSLMFIRKYIRNKRKWEFPSPLGVIFSLICYPREYKCFKRMLVSVSSRSYILSYDIYKYNLEEHYIKFPSPLGVIFSLIYI